jgi:hypothetical protein
VTSPGAAAKHVKTWEYLKEYLNGSQNTRTHPGITTTATTTTTTTAPTVHATVHKCMSYAPVDVCVGCGDGVVGLLLLLAARLLGSIPVLVLVLVLGDCHDQADAKWIVIRGSLS